MSDTPTAPKTAPHSPAEFTPYVRPTENPPEFTLPAVLTGTLLGLVFGVSSLYLVLKVGITVSASIPVAVLSITLFRALSAAFGLRRASVLENNITQTAGSAGESIAFGVGVTMPALMMLGFEMDLLRVTVVSLLGGLLGILMMIPLRRAFIVALHGRAGEPGKLLYPEGTACAQVLIAGERGGLGGTTVFAGFGLAFVHQFVTAGMGLLRGEVELPMKWYNRVAGVGAALEAALLGVGYIIGVRTAAVMMAGAVLGYLVLAPAIATFGDLAKPTPGAPADAGLLAPGDKPISGMGVDEIRKHYLLYLGAGCVATAGIISMFKTLPMIFGAVAAGLSGVAGAGATSTTTTSTNGSKEKGSAADPDADAEPIRTERDMPMTWVVGGSVVLLGLLATFLLGEVGPAASLAGAALILCFGFLFVTVSSRLTGEIGSSSNPISGMTVATLSLTCLIFLALGWTGPTERVLALSVAAVVCIAASNGGTTSQDLKTGFLVGGTPDRQQWAILIGAAASALVLGGMLIAFNTAGSVASSSADNFPRVKPELLKSAGASPVASSAGRFLRVSDALPELPDGLRNGVLLLDDKGRVTQLKGFAPEVLYAGVESYDGKEYRVWQPARHLRGLFVGLPSGKYLLDEREKIVWYVDPAVTGSLKTRPDGTEVSLKFEAPKTQVMAVIINGVLSQELNWGLVLMGAFIAVTLELCGVSSLAFAVGVYIPLAYSTPIFLGGLARWATDWLSQPSSPPSDEHQDEAAAVAKSETSPGVLLASGYIAGGSLAGVAVAFLDFQWLAGVKSAVSFGRSIEAGPLDADWPAVTAYALLTLGLLVVGFLLSSADADSAPPSTTPSSTTPPSTTPPASSDAPPSTDS